MDQLLVISVIALWMVVLLNIVLTLTLFRKLNAVTGMSAQSAPPRDLKPGEPAPDFRAETLDGVPVSLSYYSGRAVTFVFVSPTCSPCLAALPQYEALAPHAQRWGTELVLVSTVDAASTISFVEEHKTSLPMLIAPRADNPFMADYGLSSTPGYCAIDAEGKVRSAGYPNFGGGEWKALVDAWRQGEPQRPNLVPSSSGA